MFNTFFFFYLQYTLMGTEHVVHSLTYRGKIKAFSKPCQKASEVDHLNPYASNTSIGINDNSIEEIYSCGFDGLLTSSVSSQVFNWSSFKGSICKKNNLSLFFSFMLWYMVQNLTYFFLSLPDLSVVHLTMQYYAYTNIHMYMSYSLIMW